MIEVPATPVGLHMAQRAVRHALQHERDMAALAVPQEKEKSDFEGKGPVSPSRGVIVDISV